MTSDRPAGPQADSAPAQPEVPAAERTYRALDLINTDKSAKELLDRRVALVNETGRYRNDIYCTQGEYVDRLRAAGHTVHVVDTPRGLSPLGLLASTWRTFRLLRRCRFDVIHTHGSVIGLIGRTAALFARTPVVIHQVHGFHHHDGMKAPARWIFVWAERLMSALTEKLLFQNEADVQECLRRRIAPQGKLVLVGNGIEMDRFHPGEPPQNDPPVILYVGRFEPVKNHAMILETARLLRDRGVSFVLKLAGEGELLSECQDWVRRHDLGDRVEFLGYRDDIPQLTAQSEVCVLVSLKEGIPRAIIEAAACGRPIVASDVVGNRDAVVDGATGFLVPLDHAEAMADRIQELLADGELRERIGRQARAHAVEHFDERRVTQRIVEVYDRALAGR